MEGYEQRKAACHCRSQGGIQELDSCRSNTISRPSASPIVPATADPSRHPRAATKVIQVDAQRTSALRFADPQVQALCSALLGFQFLPTGFSSRNLLDRLAPLLGLQPQELTQGRITYQLRRLRLHGIIERVVGSHRYRLTGFGLRTGWFFTRTYARILRPGIASTLGQLPTPNTALRRCFDKLELEINAWADKAELAA